MWTAIIIIAALLAGYFIGQSLANEYVTCVEAGPIEGVTAETLRSKSFYAPRVRIVNKGSEQSRKDLIRVVVSGDCMRPRNIVNGTQLLVQKVSKDADISGLIQEGSILMLYLPDTRKYKIREFSEFTDDGAFSTFYYNPDESVHPSREPHGRDTLIGVVKYRI